MSSNGTTFGVTAPTPGFDTTLINEGFLDKTLQVKITDPTNTVVELVPLTGLTVGSGTVTAGAASGLDWGFALASNSTTPINQIAGTAALVVVFSNVLEADAQSLNNLIDGPAMGVPLGMGTAAGDFYGRVKYVYGAGGSSSGLVNMTIYITHR